MKKNKKENRSILFRMTVRFFIVVLAGMIAWGILSIFLSQTTVVNQSKNSSREAFSLVEDMYEYNPVLKQLARGETVDDESYNSTLLRLRCICKAFELDYLYLFRADPSTLTKTYFIVVASDDVQNERVEKFSNGYQMKVPNFSNEEELLAMTGKTPENPERISNSFGGDYTWYIPILDTEGKVDMIVGMDFNSSPMMSKLMRIVFTLLIPIIAMLSTILILLLLFVKKIVVKPLSIVSESMTRFVEDYSQDLPPLTDTLAPQGEIRNITKSYDSMKTDIQNYINDIRTFAEEKATQDSLNKITEQIQKGIMPSEKELQGEGFNAYASAESAKSVGGDFYDCFLREDGSVCVVLGDVSGKGIAAALFMAMTKTMIREHLRMGESPAQVLNFVNDDISESNPENMFATVFAMVLDPRDGRITYANAGHTPPVMYKLKTSDSTGHGSASFLTMECGMAIGLFPDAGIVDESLTLSDSQGMLLYTDGVTEAVSIDNQFFGEDRLLSAMDEALTEADAHDVNPAAVIAKKIVSDVKHFEEGCEPFDDITVLSISTHLN